MPLKKWESPICILFIILIGLIAVILLVPEDWKLLFGVLLSVVAVTIIILNILLADQRWRR